MIRAIAAIDARRGIAASGKIPWNIPADSGYFRKQTQGSTVIMGHKTYQEFATPLPNRRNIVVSRHAIAIRQGFEILHDIDAFLEQAQDDVWIIGGAGLYESTLQYCDELYVTHIEGDFNCDQFFPVWEKEFALKQASAWQTEGDYTYQFAVYARNT